MATDGAASEAGPDPATFTVTRTGPTTNALTVLYGTDGDATNGSDYQTLSGMVAIPVGQSSATITITPIDDSIDEGPEAVALNLTPDVAYTIGTPGIANATIADNDVVVAISATDPNASEVGLDPGEFTVTRTGGDLTQQVLVHVQRGGTATNGTDYVAIGGSTFFVTIPANQASSTITITPNADNVGTEGDETVILTILTNASYAIGPPASGTVTIADNEAVVSLTATDTAASETGPDSGEFTVTRSGGNLATILDVFFTIDGTAINNRDYQNIGGGVRFPANETSVTVAITPFPDNVVEGAETVTLTLNANAAYTIGPPASGTVTIADNEAVVSLTATDTAASETGPDSGEFTVTRSGGNLATILDVFFTIDGTAINNRDYQNIGGGVRFPANETSVTVAITPFPDNVVEGAETVTLTLNANAAYTIGPPASGTVTIADN